MPQAYLTGLAALAGALAGRYVQNQLIGAALPLVTAFAATAAAQWYGERRASVPVAVLSFREAQRRRTWTGAMDSGAR